MPMLMRRERKQAAHVSEIRILRQFVGILCVKHQRGVSHSGKAADQPFCGRKIQHRIAGIICHIAQHSVFPGFADRLPVLQKRREMGQRPEPFVPGAPGHRHAPVRFLHGQPVAGPRLYGYPLLCAQLQADLAAEFRGGRQKTLLQPRQTNPNHLKTPFLLSDRRNPCFTIPLL